MPYTQIEPRTFGGPEQLHIKTVDAMLAKERLDPAVAEVVPMSEVRRAHERVEAGEVLGKLVMRVTER